MGSRVTCSVCDCMKEPEQTCENCGATMELLNLISDIASEHLEELEAAGVTIFTAAGISEPPVVPMLRKLWLENETLRIKNKELNLTLRNIDSALRNAKGFSA